MVKNVGGAKLTYEGIADLTPGQTPLKGATYEIKMSRSEQRTKLKNKPLGMRKI